MLTSLRKFSSSIFAKILLGIVVVPFVFWGMGSSFTGGNKNVVVTINKEKFSTEEFINFIKRYIPPNKKTEAEDVEQLLSIYIGQKLIDKEVEALNIRISDKSLAKLVRNQKDFKRKNNFSRIEYEKFLIKNNISAAAFEADISRQEKKKQLLDLIGGGILPSDFMVNSSYDRVNQKRDIQIINLNNIFKKNITFSEEKIKNFHEENKNRFTEIFKSIKLFELTPQNLIDSVEYNDLFFKKIDEIDDLIINGKDFNYIKKNYNLDGSRKVTLNKNGEDLDSNIIKNLPSGLSKIIFGLSDSESSALFEIKNKFFIVEVLEDKKITKNINNSNTRKQILLELEKKYKIEFLTKIYNKINENSFKKTDFNEFAKKNKVKIQKINFSNLNDEKVLEKDFVYKIYTKPKNKIFILNDATLAKNYLVYIDKIENVSIDKNSDNYKKYKKISKIYLENRLYSTYDVYLKNKYKININYKALDIVKNYFD